MHCPPEQLLEAGFLQPHAVAMPPTTHSTKSIKSQHIFVSQIVEKGKVGSYDCFMMCVVSVLWRMLRHVLTVGPQTRPFSAFSVGYFLNFSPSGDIILMTD